MKTHSSLWRSIASLTACLVFWAAPFSMKAADLLQELPGAKGDDLFSYLDPLAEWVQGVCAGLAVAWVLWSGAMMIVAGGDAAAAESARKHMFAAIVGLLILLFSGPILHFINPSFFQTS